LSERNLRYTKKFYLLYNEAFGKLQQVAANLGDENVQQIAAKFNLFSVPWGHQLLLIDRFTDAPEKALFYVSQTVENGWSRSMLLNFLDTDLYERQGKALTNFNRTLPDETSDLAQELTKDPQSYSPQGRA